MPRPGWAEQDPEDWWRATQEVAGRRSAATTSPASASAGRCTGSSRSTRPTPSSARRSSGTTGARARSARRSRRRVGLDRLVALTGNRALTGFTAPKLLWLRQPRAGVLRAHRPRDAAQGLRAAAALRRARDRTSPTPRGRCCSTSRTRAGATEVLEALELDRGVAAAASLESPSVTGATRRRHPGRGRRGRPGRRRARRRASTGPGPLRWCSARRASSSPRRTPTAPTPQGRVHAFCHAMPGDVARDGRDALGRRRRWPGCATSPRPGTDFDDARRRGGGAGSRAPRA